MARRSGSLEPAARARRHEVRARGHPAPRHPDAVVVVVENAVRQHSNEGGSSSRQVRLEAPFTLAETREVSR
jgi:hypothetical protein